ncbi:unnamed protein product [Cyclocybe aegerita]|uniref:RBR-type E3 ubiquitin transferase n=1 Tax=Cyclocybe aegerita TaxID=1973307 RepID=A0A8S0W043_CYCAE|nr:unnamed protein product [Cyclocybe aegerita]
MAPVYDSHIDIEGCRSMQKEEFEVLESIYPEYISSQTQEAIIRLEVPVEFGSSTSVIISEPPSPQRSAHELSTKKPTVQTVSLAVLPPLLLHIALPPSYPLFDPPRINSIRATHVWLPNATLLLHEALVEMWQAGEPVLYNWIEYIRTGEFLAKLNLRSSSHDDLVLLSHPAPRVLTPLLIAYDESSQSNRFSQNSFPCSICLTCLKGSKCLQLACKHIFCRSCLEDFWNMCIEEGDISRVGCADQECVKKGSEANEEDVARIVSQANLERWRWLKEKRSYERDPTIVHCPVAVCQAPVPKPSDVESESGWNRLRECPRCNFTFCAFCRRTWHGPLDKCPIAQYEDLALEYINAKEGSASRSTLEWRFGRANILRLVATYREEKANLEWFKSSTTMCPGCRCFIEKTMGCNHMTCWKCSQHFCYRCGDRLNPDHPYTHFSNAQTPCYNQLFDVIDVDPEDWEPIVE